MKTLLMSILIMCSTFSHASRNISSVDETSLNLGTIVEIFTLERETISDLYPKSTAIALVRSKARMSLYNQCPRGLISEEQLDETICFNYEGPSWKTYWKCSVFASAMCQQLD